MKQRGRPAAAALALPAPEMLERVDRLRPPHQLNDEETEVWFAVVNSEPADWFSPSTAPLLVQLCRHVVHSNRIAELLEQATSDKNLTVVDYDRLLKMADRETKAITLLATKMRISQQSTTNHRGNKKPSITRKPWES